MFFVIPNNHPCVAIREPDRPDNKKAILLTISSNFANYWRSHSKKRLDLKLLQQDVASQIGVTESTLLNWEHNRSTPTLRYLPRVIAFLKYDPMDISPTTLGDRLFKYRQYKGLSQKELAKQIGIDPSTLSRLERNQGKIFNSTMAKIKLLLQGYPE